MDHQLEARVGALLGLDEADPIQRLATDLARSDRRFIDRLVAVRRDKGLTQAEVSARMGVSQGAVSQFESGHRDPKLSTIRRYALAVGVPIEHRVVVTDDRAGLLQDEAVRARHERKGEEGHIGHSLTRALAAGAAGRSTVALTYGPVMLELAVPNAPSEDE